MRFSFAIALSGQQTDYRVLKRVPEPFGSSEHEIPCEFRRHPCPCSRSSLNCESDRTKGTDFHREGYSDPLGSANHVVRPRTVIALKLSCGLDGELIRSPGMSPTGYQSPGYVASLREFGRPHSLTRAGGLDLVRPLHRAHPRRHGTYPLFMLPRLVSAARSG